MPLEAALVGLFGALLGIALTNGFGMLLELRRRRQRTVDLMAGLHAEILAGVGSAEEQLQSEERSYALSNASPFGTPDETDFVFESVKSDTSLLPIGVIHEVVLYYRLAMQSNLMTRDLRDPTFLAQSAADKEKFVRSLLAVGERQRQAGQVALSVIEREGARHGLGLDRKRTDVCPQPAGGPAKPTA